MLHGPRTNGEQVQVYEAEQDHGLAAVEHRPEAAREVRLEVRDRHLARKEEGYGAR